MRDEISDFKQDATHDLWYSIPASILDQDGFTMKIIEEDGFDSDDIGSVTIPPFAQIAVGVWFEMRFSCPADTSVSLYRPNRSVHWRIQASEQVTHRP